MPARAGQHWQVPLRVTLIYALVSAVWILFSDELVALLTRDPDVIRVASIIKGWAYVAVVSAVLYATIARYVGRIEAGEAEARESERRLSRIVHTVPAGILMTDALGKFSFANDVAARLLRVGAAEVTSRTYDDPVWNIQSVDGGPFPTEQLPVAVVLATGQPVTGVELAIVNRDGSRTVFSVNASPLRGDDSKLSGVVMGLADITERYRSEQRIIGLNRVYSTLGQMNEAIVRASDENALYLEACRIAVEYGRFRMAWVGVVEPGTETVEPVAWAGHEDGYLEKALITVADEARGQGPVGTAVRLDRVVISNDIETDPFMAPWREPALARGYRSLAALPLRIGGETRSVLTIYSSQPGAFDAEETRLLDDVAEDVAFGVDHIRQDQARRDAEAQLAEHQEHLEEVIESRTVELREVNSRLWEATEAKSRFLASMSHELRTPLNSIIGFTTILLRGKAGRISDEQRIQLEMVQRSGNRLLALINDILDLSRIESGQEGVIPEWFEVDELIDTVTSTVRPLAQERGLDLESSLPENGGALYTDREKLSRILLNLLGNAIKFTQSGRVSLDVTRNADATVFAVTDTGMGIPPDQIERIFEDFQRLDAGPNQQEGTGLGLAISHRLAETLRGELTVASEPGLGSTFAVRIPSRLGGAQE